MIGFLSSWLRRAVLVIAALLLYIVGVRVWDVQSGPPLGPWHEFVPPELSVAALDHSDWAGWMAAENAAFAATRAAVTDRLDTIDRVASNRWFEHSPVNPANLTRDWNRSFVLEPSGPPAGNDGESRAAVVRRIAAGSGIEEQWPLDIEWPRDVYSLSHVALPFPVTDGLYGGAPDPRDALGVALGTLALRGERGVLVMDANHLSRITWNPFFPFLLERVLGR